MSRRVAFRQCDVTRAIRAAKAAGATRVVVRQDGSLAIELTGKHEAGTAPEPSKAWPQVGGKDLVL